jgi:DNA-binding transcriptional LysR family regulator
MYTDLTAMRLFVRVARTESFSGAGREMGLAQSSVSRQIAQLERAVGARLFFRTTRAVVLTQDGASYLEKVEPLILALDEADEEIRSRSTLSGTMRVSAPANLCAREVVPRLCRFLNQNPLLNIDIDTADLQLSTQQGGCDLRLVTAEIEGNGRAPLESDEAIVVAAPSYLHRAGVPEVPADLAQHVTIIWSKRHDGTHWTFERAGQLTFVTTSGRIRTGDVGGAIAAACAGAGVCQTEIWECRREVMAGQLVRILANWHLPQLGLYAETFERSPCHAAACAFVDYLRAELIEVALV